MAEAVLSEIAEKFSELFIEKLGSEIYKLARRKGFIQKFVEKIEGIIDIFRKRRTIFIIGAGEIATEISIAALNKGWKVIVIGIEPDYSPLNAETPIPIKNVPFYRHLRIKEKEGFYFERWPSKDKGFQWTVRKNLNTDTLCEMIITAKPDVVLLEDMFLTPNEWAILYQKVSQKLGQEGVRKEILFLPPVLEITDKNYTVSDILMSKKCQKEFLASLGFTELLGTHKDIVEVNIKNGEIKTDYVRRIHESLDGWGKIILKWDTVSSGHGQIIITDPSELTANLIKQSIMYAQRRVKNTSYVIERYVENKKEAIVVVAKTKEGLKILDGIYYEKFDPERIREQRYKLLSRLKKSETVTGDITLWDRMISIAVKIAVKLPVPFVYVEFLIDTARSEVFINEISYRPDDAGFVTLLSHKKDQFSIFIDSLDWWLTGGGFCPNSKEIIPFEPGFCCDTICPKERIDNWPRENINYDMRLGPLNKQFIISFYEKYILEKDGIVDYGRIVGFIWHHRDMDPKIILDEYKEVLDIGRDLFRVVYEFLEEQSGVEDDYK